MRSGTILSRYWIASLAGGAGSCGPVSTGGATAFFACCSFLGCLGCCCTSCCFLGLLSLSLSLAMIVFLGVDLFAVRLEHANLAAVIERLEADAVAFLRGRIEQREVGNVDRHVLVDDAALDVFHRVRALVLLHPVHAFHHDVLGVHAAQHCATLALVATRDHDHFIALLDPVHHSTSGARETIFMKRSVRSSRVTGPKMRVPIGSSFAVSSTTAFESKRTSDPSPRRTPLAVRTTTAS